LFSCSPPHPLVLPFSPVRAPKLRDGSSTRETSRSSATIGGIAHIYGKTDADTVFGALYAQAGDDFSRAETNYLNSMGRLAEAEGEGKIYQDLRMKLFINPAELQAQYAASPAWLKALMDAYADGLNYYLAKHPDVKPRVIRHFEPWMALSHLTHTA
jgi:acyl-homoserine-lactone acylase